MYEAPSLGVQPGTTLKLLFLWQLPTRMKESPDIRGVTALPRPPAKRGPRSHCFICCALILVAGLMWSGDVKSMGFVSNPVHFHWQKLVISVKPLHPVTHGSSGIIHSCSCNNAKPPVSWWSKCPLMRRAVQVLLKGLFRGAFKWHFLKLSCSAKSKLLLVLLPLVLGNTRLGFHTACAVPPCAAHWQRY